MSATSWTFEEVINKYLHKEFPGCLEIGQSCKLLLDWLNFHNIFYSDYRKALINVLTKALPTINTVCFEGPTNIGKLY